MIDRKPIEHAWLYPDPHLPPIAFRSRAEADAGRLPKLFASPVLALIEAISREAPEHARMHLRKPIFVDREPSFAERALVRGAAKRIRCAPELPEADWREIPPTLAPVISPRPLSTREEISEHLQSLIGGSAGSGPLYARDRPVSAIALDANGELLAEARNEGGSVRCRHAEMNLLRALSHTHRELPRGTKIYVSLKPCRMCAAFLVSAAPDLRSFDVFFGAPDPGKLATGTALDPASAGRFTFLMDREARPPSQAAAIIAHPDYRHMNQWPPTLVD